MNQDNKTDWSILQPGSWFDVKFGFTRRVFYVIRGTERGVYASMTSWLTTSQEFFTWEDLDKGDADFIGNGKRRWWRKFFFNSWLIPIYSKPANLRD